MINTSIFKESTTPIYDWYYNTEGFLENRCDIGHGRKCSHFFLILIGPWSVFHRRVRTFRITSFLYKKRFFSNQPQCCFTFTWIELQMLLRSCLIHINIITRQFLYYLYLCPCLDLGLFMSYLSDLFFIFIFISPIYTYRFILSGIDYWIKM